MRTTRRAWHLPLLLPLVAAACLAAPGCASWYQPPVEKPAGAYSLEQMDQEHLDRLRRDLSLYSD